MMASSVAPTAMTPSVSSELVPAPARTAGIAKTPVPMMLPMTSPVAEVSPSARAFCWLRGDISPRGIGAPRGVVMVDIGYLLPGVAIDSRAVNSLFHPQPRPGGAAPARDVGPR